MLEVKSYKYWTGLKKRTLSTPFPPPRVSGGWQFTAYLSKCVTNSKPRWWVIFFPSDHLICIRPALFLWSLCLVPLGLQFIKYMPIRCFTHPRLFLGNENHDGPQAQNPHGPNHLVCFQPEDKWFLYINESVISVNLHCRLYFHGQFSMNHCLLSVGGIMVIEKNLKINLNVTMKVRMTNGLLIKMLLDIQMYLFWLISQERSYLGTPAGWGVPAWGPLLYTYQIGTMQYVGGSGATTRASQNSLPMSNSLNE